MRSNKKKSGWISDFSKNDFSCTSGSIKLKIAPNASGKTRVGVIVGTRIEKKSVRRNRIKRQIREIVRRRARQTGKKFNILAIIQKQKNKNTEEKKIKEDLNEALEKASVLFKEP